MGHFSSFISTKTHNYILVGMLMLRKQYFMSLNVHKCIFIDSLSLIMKLTMSINLN